MAIPDLAKLAYKTLQQGKGLAGIAHKGLSTKLMELLAPEAIPTTEPISTNLLMELRHSMNELECVDWEDAENGLYPKSLLFEAPWLDWAKRYPLIWFDLPSTWERRKKGRTKEIPNEISPEIYPPYYLQNFHHQTDGYLSDHSAGLYDLQVEILFNGTADSMRRRVIAPLKNGLKEFHPRNISSLKVLDIATGTGRTLHQIRSAIPDIQLLGIDLSAAYLRQASQWLNKDKNELAQLIRANAEELPFPDNFVQAATCVFLLHELPPKARLNVIREGWRVLEPGGVLILADSIQIRDSPKFRSIMENFPKIFHEPYYQNYLTDDIEQHLQLSGFTKITAKSFFMTRVWTATKPLDS